MADLCAAAFGRLISCCGWDCRRRRRELNEIKLKILLVGETGVGKTSLISRFTENKFNENEEPTEEADTKVKHLVIDGQPICLEICDTPGQGNSRLPQNYRDVCGVVLVYDISSTTTFQKLEDWLEQLKVNQNRKVITMVVGNKTDLSSSKRTIAYDTGKRFAKNHGSYFAETSAANNNNVDLLFEDLVAKILEENMSDDYYSNIRSDMQLEQTNGRRSGCFRT